MWALGGELRTDRTHKHSLPQFPILVHPLGQKGSGGRCAGRVGLSVRTRGRGAGLKPEGARLQRLPEGGALMT